MSEQNCIQRGDIIKGVSSCNLSLKDVKSGLQPLSNYYSRKRYITQTPRKINKGGEVFSRFRLQFSELFLIMHSN